MLRELLALPQFNGNRLAAILDVNYRVLSRWRLSGALSAANFRELKRQYKLHVLGDFSTADVSVDAQMAIEKRVLDSYKARLKERIAAVFSKRFKQQTITRINRVIDTIHIITYRELREDEPPNGQD